MLQKLSKKQIIIISSIAALIILFSTFAIWYFRTSAVENVANLQQSSLSTLSGSSQANVNSSSVSLTSASISSNSSSSITNISTSSSTSISSSASQISEPSKKPLQSVKIYLGDFNKANTDCGATVEIERQIPITDGVAKAALFELFRGENSQEAAKGYQSSFKNWSEVFNSMNLKEDGTLQIDLSSQVLPKDGGDKYNWGTLGTSCGSGQMQQLRQTMKQFPSIKYVIFSVEGKLQTPDNFYGCPSGGEAKPASFEAEKWEELKRQCGV